MATYLAYQTEPIGGSSTPTAFERLFLSKSGLLLSRAARGSHSEKLPSQHHHLMTNVAESTDTLPIEVIARKHESDLFLQK
jgi:hypothetical protein